MSLTKCPECEREVSDKAKTCPHCGYSLQHTNPKSAITENVPFVLSIAYTICVFFYATDYLWVFTSIMKFAAGLAMTLLLFPRSKLSPHAKSTAILALSIVGSFFVTFDYNLTRLEWGFFNNYSDSLGVMLGLFQAFAVISMILLLLKMFMPQVSKNVTIVCCFVSGILGIVFSIFEVNYLSSRWGTGSNAFYIWAGFVSLLWFLTQATYLMSVEED